MTTDSTTRPPKWLQMAAWLMSRTPPFRGRWRLTSLLHLRLAGQGWSATTRVNGYAMRLLLDDLIGRSTYVDGVWERENSEVAEKLLRPGARVFDVGANAGYFSLLFASLVGETGRVFAFEPVRSTADRWRANFALNPSLQSQTTLFEIALSDTAGMIEMEIEGVRNTGASHVMRANDAGATLDSTDASRSSAMARPGDEVWAELGRPDLDLVKLDIEGHELFALRGMSSLLRGSANLSVLIEVRDHALRAAGGSRDEVFRLMFDQGFHSYDYSPTTGSFTRNDASRDGELIVFSKRTL